MHLISLPIRPVLHSALAALVVAALAHCMGEDARELAQWSRTVALHRAALPTPVQTPVHDCDHEYGCICRGAMQVQAIDATPFQPLPSDLLPLDRQSLSDGCIADNAAPLCAIAADIDAAAPCSGRQLRALYASLVI